MLAVDGPELRIEINDSCTDPNGGRTFPFVSLSVVAQTVNGMPSISLTTRRLPRIDVAQLNSASDPRYEEFQRVYDAFNQARRQLFRKIRANRALEVHRDLVREALLRRLDQTTESCILNQDSSLLFLRFVADNFFQYPYRLFLRRYPSLIRVVSEEEFLLMVHGLRRRWREPAPVPALDPKSRTAFRFVEAGIERFAAECILDPSKDTGRRPQPGTKMSVPEVVPIDSGGHLAIEEQGIELPETRRFIEPLEEIISRLTEGDAEGRTALIWLCGTPRVSNLADLERSRCAQAGLPEPTKRQFSNLARDFRSKHRLVERAIAIGLAQDAGYTNTQIKAIRGAGRLEPRKLRPSRRAKPESGEPTTTEALAGSLLNASRTVHCDRIAGKPVYAHDPIQEPPKVRVAPFHGAEGPLRLLYSPGSREPGEQCDELLALDTTVGGGTNLHPDLRSMTYVSRRGGGRADKRRSSDVGIAPITPRSWVSMPNMLVLKPIPLEGTVPDPAIATRPVTKVALRPRNHDGEAISGAVIGSVSRTSGERRLHNLPHDEALEAANRDRVYSDERYGHTTDFPALPESLRAGGIQRYPLAIDDDVPAELNFQRVRRGLSRPPRETEQEIPWLPRPYPRKYVDNGAPGEDEHSTRGLRLIIEVRSGQRVYAFSWPEAAGLNIRLEDCWLTRLLLKVGMALGHRFKPFGWPSNIERVMISLPAGSYQLVEVLNESLQEQPV